MLRLKQEEVQHGIMTTLLRDEKPILSLYDMTHEAYESLQGTIEMCNVDKDEVSTLTISPKFLIRPGDKEMELGLRKE